MCSLGHPNKSDDGLRKLYDEVLHADIEMKRIMKEMPRFYHDDETVQPRGLPEHVVHQKHVGVLSFAHKVGSRSQQPGPRRLTLLISFSPFTATSKF